MTASLLLGEDVLDPYGGAFGVTKGLSDRFPGRVLTTPIAEGGIVGAGVGLALRGRRPIVEIMFGDFITLAVDQLVNHAAKFRAMYGGRVTVPLVVRTPMGGRRGYGPTHSQSLEKLLLGVPGLRVIAPSVFHDPGAILRDAVLHGDTPTLLVEHKLLYPAPLVAADDPLLTHAAADDDDDTRIVRNFSLRRPRCHGRGLWRQHPDPGAGDARRSPTRRSASRRSCPRCWIGCRSRRWPGPRRSRAACS